MMCPAALALTAATSCCNAGCVVSRSVGGELIAATGSPGWLFCVASNTSSARRRVCSRLDAVSFDDATAALTAGGSCFLHQPLTVLWQQQPVNGGSFSQRRPMIFTANWLGFPVRVRAAALS